MWNIAPEDPFPTEDAPEEARGLRLHLHCADEHLCAAAACRRFLQRARRRRLQLKSTYGSLLCLCCCC